MKIHTHHQSNLSIVLGALTCIIAFFMFFASMSSVSRNPLDSGVDMLMSILMFFFGLVFVGLGNRRVIDSDELLEAISKLVKKQQI